MTDRCERALEAYYTNHPMGKAPAERDTEEVDDFVRVQNFHEVLAVYCFEGGIHEVNLEDWPTD
jgi:hypothetical protein